MERDGQGECSVEVAVRSAVEAYWIAYLPLVAYSEDADYGLCREVSIKCDLPRAAEGNYQLADLSCDATTDERVIAQCLDPITNGFHGFGRNIGIVLSQEFDARSMLPSALSE
jgi:hypothetical protein